MRSLQALVSSLGWTYLDVRSALENEEVGRVRMSVNVPFVNCTKKYDSKQGKKVVQKQDNPDFVKMVRKHQPCGTDYTALYCQDLMHLYESRHPAHDVMPTSVIEAEGSLQTSIASFHVLTCHGWCSSTKS